MIYTRLSHNNNNWQFPSGIIGKSPNNTTHEGIYGFGFEEWLFSQNHVISDKNGNKIQIGYIEGIHRNYQVQDEQQPLTLFTIMYPGAIRIIVGTIPKWQKISQYESSQIVNNNPILIQEMRRQVAEATNNNIEAIGKFDLHQAHQNGFQLFNVKFETFDDLYIHNVVLNYGHFITRFYRFWLYRR